MFPTLSGFVCNEFKANWCNLSRYSCAARELYFFGASAVTQLCWAKNWVWKTSNLYNTHQYKQAKINYCICVAAQLHLPQLYPCPISVQLRGPHKSQMYTQSSMDCGTVNADKNAISNRSPCWIFCIAIKAHLKQ